MMSKHFATTSKLIVSIFALVVWFSAFEPCSNAHGQQSSEDQVNVRLRISWGGGTAETWQGNIHFHDATISNPVVLGMNIESPAALDIQPHAIRIKQLAESTFEGIEIDVEGHADSLISFQLTTTETQSKRQQLKLSDFIRQTEVFPLDETNNRISFQRAGGDQIRIVTDRDHMIFNTGESFEFQVQANLVSGANQGAMCEIETVAVDSRAAISRTVIALPCADNSCSELIKQAVVAPSTEGVYEINFTLSTGEDIGLLPTRKQLATRTIQFVVLEDRPFENQSEIPWEPVLELFPNDLRPVISPPVNQLSRLVGVSDRTASIGKFSIRSQPDPAVVLPPGGWQSITLDIDDEDAKHLIEIEYDGRHSMALGCSILVPNENGAVSNFGFDSGFSVEDSVVGSANSGKAVHRFAFWPDAKQVVLLIANRNSQKTAEFNRLRLLQRPDDFNPRTDTTPETRPAKRRMMALYEQPLFAENFGVRSTLDAMTQQPISDWSTFYQGAERLVSHLHDIGASGAFINILGEGSSLVPLKTAVSSPRYDTGVFSMAVSDIGKKDVVELLYRIFERENLNFVPLLTFDFPLSAIEFNDAADTRLIDYRGIKRQAVEYDLPRYNPLSLEVREHINSIVEEIAQRYRQRKGYEGIALACRPDTCTLLPGSRDAGYDSETIRRFHKETKIAEPLLSGSELLSPTHAQNWLDWRSAQMSEWYEQISRIGTAGRRNAKCHLAIIDICRNEEFASILSPALHHSPDIAEAMKRMGMASELSTKRNRIVVMQPQRYAPLHPLSSKKSDFEMQSVGQFTDWFSGQHQTASLFYNRSAWARFENLENSSLFGKNSEPILRLQQLSRSGRWSCQPLARVLLENDSTLLIEGGLLMNCSVNKFRKDFAQVLSQLSVQRFGNAKHATHPDERHPVAVRYLHTEDGTEIYLLNSSPWQVEATIQSSKVVANGFEHFGRTDWLPVDASERPSELRVTLEPFELLGGRVPGKRVELREFTYRLPDSAQQELNASYYKLRSKLVASGNARPLDWLGNPGFEKQSLEDWSIGNQSAEFASVDSSAISMEGQSALRIKNSSAQNVWVRSDVIPVPETGRLSISVWLKLGDGQPQPPLRISVESDDPKNAYYRFAEVGSLNLESAQNQLAGDWRQFAVHFDDIPQQPISGLRIGFDMIGAGEVWVDNVELFDRWLDENDAKAITQMLASIGPLLNETETLERCRKILDSYWPTFLRKYFANGTAAEPVVDVQDKPVRSTMRQRFRRFVSPGIFQFR